MSDPCDVLREQLLAQQAPATALARYRAELEGQLERNERGLKRERIGVRILWSFLVLTSTTFLILGAMHHDAPWGAYFSVQAVFWFLFGAVELLKHFINRARVEVLRDLKAVQLELAELKAELASRGKESP
jgi:hypothetical protein